MSVLTGCADLNPPYLLLIPLGLLFSIPLPSHQVHAII
jgi:hypothetical protein